MAGSTDCTATDATMAAALKATSLNARRMPVGIQSFEKIRSERYVYVDKTLDVWNLTQNGGYYFLSRPRRFGKSLLTTTLDAYFRGQRDLFTGLAIEQLEATRGDEAWAVHPVIHFDLAGGRYSAPNGLEDKLDATLCETTAEYGIGSLPDETLPVRFTNLIKRLYEKTGQGVVVLVDEYDKPLLDTMNTDPDQMRANRRLYKDFFGILKSVDQYIRFAFITGITRFTGVSIFSDLNQFDDISIDKRYATICGITESEMRDVFAPEITQMAQFNGQTESECLDRLAQTYDGYHFAAVSEGVYNPFSLVKAFSKQEFGYYWFASATPSSLIHRLAQTPDKTVADFDEGVNVTEGTLSDYGVDTPSLIPLYYQAGYLTIKGSDSSGVMRSYTLGFPNNEVRYGFLDSLLNPIMSGGSGNPLNAYEMLTALRRGDVESFMDRLTAFLASIPYPDTRVMRKEWGWRNYVYALFLLMGLRTKAEPHLSGGRSDCVVETDRAVYIFEFTVDDGVDAALAQIDEKGYALPYAADPRTVVKVGVNFSSATRTISEWKVA